MPKVCRKSPESLPKVSRKSAKSLPTQSLPTESLPTESLLKVCRKSAESLPKVCRKSAESLPKVCRKSAESLPKVCRKSAESLPKVCQKSAKSLPKVCPKSALCQSMSHPQLVNLLVDNMFVERLGLTYLSLVNQYSRNCLCQRCQPMSHPQRWMSAGGSSREPNAPAIYVLPPQSTMVRFDKFLVR
jgi:hypothetical protein